MSDLQERVQRIANHLTAGFEGELNAEDEEISAYDYLQDALDIEYRVGSDGTYRSARVLVAFGGPNIWIDTRTNTVEGAWWGDCASAAFTDKIGLDYALQELWETR